MLPIEEMRQEILSRLEETGRVVVSAPPGAGKSTQVPKFLLESAMVDGTIIVTQPRRLAARMLASRVAEELGSRAGDLVGYCTRHESAFGPGTRILFVTEGLLLRFLVEDPLLHRVGAVILDEFHERHLEGDLALGLVRRAQETRGPDFKLAVMSATLDTDLVTGYLGCPLVRSGHWVHDVSVYHVSTLADEPVWISAARAVSRILHSEPNGDVLVFMPGMYEIRRTLERCREMGLEGLAQLLPLHGELPFAQQDRAVRTSSYRKVVVATNVAETSITVEGIRHVVDSGLARLPHFDPRRGMNVLAVKKISQASAEQRAGRAGRTAPGTCHRLYTIEDFNRRKAHEIPEVLRLDLAQAVLLLRSFGYRDPGAFPWLQPPPTETIENATHLLRMLQAISPDGSLSSIGQRMALLPMHPRLSRMLVGAAPRDLPAACRRAAILAERPIFARNAPRNFADISTTATNDIELAEEALQRAVREKFNPTRCYSIGINAQAARDVERAGRQFLRLARESATGQRKDQHGLKSRYNPLVQPEGDASDTKAPPSDQGKPASTNDQEPSVYAKETQVMGELLLSAFPDRVAALRSPAAGIYELIGGTRAVLESRSRFGTPELILALEIIELVSPSGPASTISFSVPVSVASLEALYPHHIERRTELSWNSTDKAVEEVRLLLYQGLEVQRISGLPTDPARASELLVDKVVAEKLPLEGWTEEVDRWINRVRCVAEWFPDKKLPAYDEEDMVVILREAFAGAVRYSQVKKRPLISHVRNALDYNDQRFVDEMAPERFVLPRGVRMRIEYVPGALPKGRARIQDLYDLNEQPRIAGGRVPVLLEILAPNFRPVQTTGDLPGFWRNLYPKLKRELARKYPRHEWR